MSTLRTNALQTLDSNTTVNVADILKKGQVSPADIPLPQGGNLSMSFQSVSPEQYGAIGDGTLHPLSERYATLSEAQAMYPFVTALTQSIDWAACQKAENDNRGIRPINCPFYAKYHLGNNYLSLGEKSKWYGNTNPTVDRPCTTFIREGTNTTFGQNCIVRVMNSSDAGSTDEFVRGIVFKGFYLTRNRPRRYNSKYDSTIGFHANFAMRADVDVAISGCEYGFLGYGCWGLTGRIRVDSCHKSIWLDPDTSTPEYVSKGGSITALDLRVEVDACVYGPVLRHCQYSKLSGWVEGMIIDSTVFPIYDSVNETAIAISAYGCDGLDITSLGIEAWQGVHFYANNSTASINLKWNQDRLLTSTTGKHGPYHSMSVLMSNTELFTLPAGNNAYFYALNGGLLILRNMTGDMSGTGFNSTYLVNLDTISRFQMENTGIYFGSNRQIAPANWINIDFVNDRFMSNYMTPSGYTYEGRGVCTATGWSTKAINAGDGRVSLSYGSEIPTGWSLVDWTVHVITGTQTQASSIGISSVNDTSVTFQTNVTSSGFSIQYKLRLRVNK